MPLEVSKSNVMRAYRYRCAICGKAHGSPISKGRAVTLKVVDGRPLCQACKISEGY